MNKIMIILCVSFLALAGKVNAQTANTQISSAGKPVPIAEFYEGGQTAMYTFINQNMIYPAMAKRNRIQGECIASCALEADGRITQLVIVKGLGGGCNEETLRLIKLLKFRAPGYRKQYSIPVYYKL
jgi:protein TonB